MSGPGASGSAPRGEPGVVTEGIQKTSQAADIEKGKHHAHSSFPRMGATETMETGGIQPSMLDRIF